MRRLVPLVLVALLTGSAGSRAAVGGGLIAFSLDGPTSSSAADLYVIRSDGSGLRRLTRTPGIIDESPSWSPDGSRIAYSRHGFVGSVGEIWVMNADGSGARRLFKLPSGWAYLRWSPDGKWIAFSEPFGDAGIFLIASDGSRYHRIPGTIDGDAAPSWTHDGKRLMFDAGAGEIDMIGIDGKGRRQLFKAGYTPDVSPDARTIALAYGDNTSAIWLANPAGTAAHRLTKADDDYAPTWSTDSKRIAFVRGPGIGVGALYVIGADGKGLRRLGTMPRVERPAWQP